DDSGKTMSVPLNVDESAEKNSNVIDGDNLNLTERTPTPSTRWLRSNVGKSMVVSSVPVKTAKKKKIYGLKRQWSKITGPSEPKKKILKRKVVSSSDLEFEDEQYATAFATTSSKKSVKRKRIPQVSLVPIENISFHRVENADRWNWIDENCNWAPTTHSKYSSYRKQMIVDLKVFSNVNPGVLDDNAGGDTGVEEEDSDASPSM
ncbi:hypothetical protein L195_g051382, partial [Trifolium pratense]